MLFTTHTLLLLLLLPLIQSAASLIPVDCCSRFYLSDITAHNLSRLLHSGQLSVVDLLAASLENIEKYDPYLNSVISLTPIDELQATARFLDYALQHGHSLGPLHGIPILVKDSIVTQTPSTTAGSYAFTDAIFPGEHSAIANLRRAGAIILGKTNLSVFSNFRSRFGGTPNGWSPVGGQTYSAYVRPNGTENTPESDPGGSSSGSAVAVAAGFASIALAAETDGSIIFPANRAGLYGIKPTVGISGVGGVVPVARSMDSVGLMAKGVWDVIAGLEAMVEPLDKELRSGWWKSAELGWTNKWQGMRIGIAPRSVYFNSSYTENMEIVEACNKVLEVIVLQGAEVVEIDLPYLDEALTYNAEGIVTQTEFHEDMDEFLSSLSNSSIQSLSDLIDYNTAHEGIEMPPGYCCQEIFLAAIERHTDAEYLQAKEDIERISRSGGIDYALHHYNISVILSPAEGPSSSMSAMAGYPIAAVPLGHLESGRPFGMAAWGGKQREGDLFRVMAAWENTVGWRESPDLDRLT